MTTSTSGAKALVSVFDDLESAGKAVLALRQAGFEASKIELVTYDLPSESPLIETPVTHPSTTSCMMDSAANWGRVGIGTGVTAGVVTAAFTGFPGIALGMLAISGLTGAIVGGMAGVERAVADDTVDLPTLDEYAQLLSAGHRLVVVHGDHENVMAARDIINHLSKMRSTCLPGADG